MKILIDLRSINYGRSGGIENYAYFVINSLLSYNIELILDVSPFSKYFFINKYGSFKNIKIIYDPILNILNTVVQKVFPGRYKALGRRKSWAKKAKADFVFLPSHLDKYQHIHLPGIIVMHSYLPDYKDKIKRIISFNAKVANILITSWNYPYQEFIKTFPQYKSKWFLLHYIASHNVDENKQKVLKGLPNNYLLYVSFFSERKNQLRLVEAYYNAKRKNSKIPKLVLAGGDNSIYKIKVKELIKKLNFSNNVILYDYLPDGQISFLYHNCLAVIAPTLWEAASGAVLEGTYCGKPVVCSDVPPLKDFANYFGLEMIFFNPYDVNEIEEKILMLYNNYERIKILGNANKEKLRKYNDTYFARTLLDIIRSRNSDI